ncbi:MAG: hypothetical protein JNK56_03220 [Myxococcales bacterium]|nr:hypothetical protein [Myxococcales bacterium]
MIGIDVGSALLQIAIMSRFEATFRTAIANAERDVLVDQIRANPQMSLQELGKLSTGELGGLLRHITVGDLVGGGAGNIVGNGARSGGEADAAASAKKSVGRPKGSRNAAKPAAAAAKPAAAKAEKPAAKASAGEVDTRTAEGRAAYDSAVLAALRASTGPQSASDLTRVAGGSPLQIRTSLARLIETGGVHWSGRARGTRYTPA